MIANDIRYHGLLHFATDTHQMVKALVTFGMLGRLMTGQHSHKTIGHANRINHLMLGIARMYIASLERNLGRSSVEVLEFQFAYLAAIHRIGPVATEFLDIKFMGTQADFFIRIETNTYLAMLDFGMLLQIDNSRNYFGNTSLVVSPQQRFAIGHDQILPLMIQQFGELCW